MDEKRRTDGRVYLRAFYRGNRLRFWASMVLMGLSTTFCLIISMLLGDMLDIITAGDIGALGRITIFVVALIPILLVVELTVGWLRSVFVHRALEQYKALAFSRLTEKSISAFTRENTGRYLSVLTNDVNSIEENYLNRSFLLVYHCVLFVGALGTMLWYDWRLTLVTVVLSALPILISITLGQGLSRREQAVSGENERFVATLQDLLRGFSVIKSFKAEGRVRGLFDQANHRLEQTKRKRRWFEHVLGGFTNTGSLVLQMGVFICGAWLAIRGEITAGTVIIFVNLSGYLLQPIQIVPQYWASRRAARSLVDKLAQVTAENAAHTGRPIPQQLQDAIQLRDVTFGYEPDKPILDHLSVRFEPGKRYALVGTSGAGKSTLLNLLMGSSRDYSGSITVDGVEMRDIDPDSLYDLISLISQNVFLFDDTIRNNITMFGDFSPEQVDAAVRQAGLDGVLEQRGEDYRCGENGVGLSGGERQRVSIARSLLRGTPVLLVDEATAALDAHTASRVTSAILDLPGITSIVVTHRLEEGLLRRYDGILVLKNGAITEQGTFAELMERRGLFYSLFTVANG